MPKPCLLFGLFTVSWFFFPIEGWNVFFLIFILPPASDLLKSHLVFIYCSCWVLLRKNMLLLSCFSRVVPIMTRSDVPAEASTSLASFENFLHGRGNHISTVKKSFHPFMMVSASCSRTAASPGLKHHHTNRIHQSGKCLVKWGIAK